MDTCLFIIGAFEPEHLASTASTPGAGRAAWLCCPPGFSPAAHYRTLEESRAIVSPFKQCRAASSSPAVLRRPAAGLLPQRCSPAPSETFGNDDGRSGVCSPLQSHLDKWPGACDCLATTYLAFITIVFTYSSTFYSIRIVAFKAERSICSSKLPSQSRFFFIVFADARCRAPSSPRAALPATAGSQVNPHS
nr:relaxin receptor 2-like [Columba livia]